MPERVLTYRYRGSVPPPESREPVRAHVTPRAAVDGAGQTATLRIDDVIDSWGGFWGISAREISAVLDALPDDVTTIDLEINSPGGEATEGVAIMNALRKHPATVNATVTGIAASAASLIAMGANRLEMAPATQLMIHDAWSIGIGNADDLRHEADVVDKISQSYAGVYATKAGGSADDWRSIMKAESWYTADEAVEAGLADGVLATSSGDAQSAAARFDLTVFAYAGREQAPAPFIPGRAAARAPEAPAASADGSTTHERSAAVAFTDEQLTTMRQQLGVTDDADESAILAALGEALAERADPPAVEPTPSAVPAGSVVVDQNVLDELRIAARAGQEARAVQLRQDRDDTISAAIASGHISPARREHWMAQWDADADGARASIATLTESEPLFPVGPTSGYAGDDGGSGESAAWSDDEADALAGLAGLPKGALR